MTRIEQRVLELEKSNRILRLAVAVVALGCVARVMIGAVAADDIPNEIRARSFVVVDHKGKVGASLESIDCRGLLKVFNSQGKEAVTLSGGIRDRGWLRITDESGNDVVTMIARDSQDKTVAGSITLSDNKRRRVLYAGSTGLCTFDAADKPDKVWP